MHDIKFSHSWGSNCVQIIWEFEKYKKTSLMEMKRWIENHWIACFLKLKIGNINSNETRSDYDCK